MVAGLDFGTDRLLVARGDDDDPVTTSEPAVVAAVDGNALADAGFDADDLVQFERAGTTYVVGTDAERVAAVTGATVEPMLERDVLRAGEHYADALAALVAATPGGDVGGEQACFTTPGTVRDAALPTDAHRSDVAALLDGGGFDATPVSTGLAVLYDALDPGTYTGLGVAVRSTTTCVALAYYGVPVVAFSLATGTDDLVERAARESGASAEEARDALSSFALGLDTASGGVEGALGEAYDELVSDVLTHLEREADDGDVRSGVSAPVVVAGAGAVPGLDLLLGGRLDDAAIPISVSDVTRPGDPADAPVRGALAAAAADVDAYDAVTWSETGGTDDTDAGRTGVDDVGGRPTGRQSSLTAMSATTGAETHGGAADGGTADRAIDQMFERLGQRDDELDEVQADVTALADRLGDLQDALGELDARAADDADVETLQEAVDGVAADLSDLTATVDDLTGDLSDLADDVAALDDRAVDVAAHEELATRVADLEADVDAATATIATVETEVDSVQRAVEDLSDDLDATRTRLLDRVNETDEGLADVTDQVEDLAATTADADALASTAQDLGALRDHVNDLDDRAATTDEVQALDADVRDLEERADAALELGDDATDRLDAHADRLGAVEDVAEAASTTSNRVDDVAASVETVADRVGSVDSRVDAVDQRLDVVADASARVDDLAETVAELEARVEVVREAAARDDGSDLDARVDEVAADVDGVRDDVEHLRDAVEATGAVGERLVAGLAGGAVVAGLLVLAQTAGSPTLVGGGGLVVGLAFAGVLWAGQ
ncbi:hypothetical protein [Haloarchaeobius sp. HRN-SO-5]|uniref:hypothetical protein n=1 Tax=Haloarchaeobius sp. HRN-SO-5 TaxID=3446118 RepID=UPI003EC0655A